MLIRKDAAGFCLKMPTAPGKCFVFTGIKKILSRRLTVKANLSEIDEESSYIGYRGDFDIIGANVWH
jgi:hypothetical protein